ncbi:hypothetical protein BKA66DRAFT_448073 [Pyrenochaeta sp. MPI-SDFR-AT-0127]|nr:hypothetical protein BKA66DRAFT_448073 [Pyrenochaeta sp. MPI-SDFR-AT-0127]
MGNLSRNMIERWINQGNPIVIYERCALQLGVWVDQHPGGRLTILHMVGRDATDEINMYVVRSRDTKRLSSAWEYRNLVPYSWYRYHSSTALLMLERYIIGRVAEPWVNTKSPVRVSDPYDKRIASGRDSTRTAPDRAYLQHRSGSELATTHRRVCHLESAAEAEEQEDQASLQSSPPLDARTQQATARDYRDCYSEHAVEFVSCGLLFGAFLYLLRRVCVTRDFAINTLIGAQ